MATNPGGVDLNTDPYYDDYNEDKKFVRILYRPGRAVQARELTQQQTLNQAQTKRFADYFFKQGAIIDGCEQNLDLSLPYVKIQTNFSGSEVDITDFENQVVFGANNGIKAFCGIVTDLEGNDPKTLFVNYLTVGSIVLTVNNAASTITPGNTITFSTGNTATIEASYIDPISGANKLFVSAPVGTLTTTTANTIDSTGSTIVLNVTAVNDKRSIKEFLDAEQIFTSNVATRAYANAETTRATTYIENEGLATEIVYTRGSKFTISDGYIYLSDYFIKNDAQTIVLDKYKNNPSYKIGIVPNKSFVDYIGDSTLVDNAQGTPNFQAPGADRLKIDTVLTKVALTADPSDPEFITLAEVDAGILKKRKIQDVESKLEDAIAKRTFEQSGDFTINDPKVGIREHLLQNNNGGRYSAADGGNSDLLLVEVDPFTAYVSGYRNELIVKKELEVTKGLDTEYVEQTKTQINYGYYVEVKELCGAWDIMEATKVDLYDTVQQAITGEAFSLTSPTGTKIGEARVRGVEYVSGTQGTADARYYVYLYEIFMEDETPGVKYTFDRVRALYDSATPARFADVVAGTAVVQEPGFNSLLFKLPYDAIKTIRDTSDNVETGFRFRKKFSVTFSTGVATISTTDSSETFVGTGILNATQKNDFYAVIINNGGTDVETSALTGTVTVSAGTTAVSGSGTSFTTEVNVGDIIKIGSQEIRVSAITNDTSLTLEDNHTAGATGASYTKILPTGALIPLNLFGGTGSGRTINVTSPGTVQIDIKEDATFTAEVVATMDRANAREKRKILNYQATANINPNTHIGYVTGGTDKVGYSLGYADVYQIHAIYQSSDFNTSATTSNTNVTSSYDFYTGQSDNAYNHSYIVPKSGVQATGRLLVVFDYFSHDTTQGLGYCSVDSYPVDDDATSNTTILTSEIPTYVTSTGQTIRLRDAIDFRPIKTANTFLNPIDDLGYQIPTGGLHIPTPSSDFDADLIYYKGRIVKVFVSGKGTYGINNGKPKSAGNVNPAPPPKLPDTLEIAEIFIPPYPSQPREVAIQPLKNKRFTMKDVSQISNRVEKLEYFNALGYLEKQATDKQEIDELGLDRFKNGILVDPFVGTAITAVDDPYWKSTVDEINKFVTSRKDNTGNTNLQYVDTTTYNSTTLKTTGGQKVFLNYTEETFIEQPKASSFLNLAQELIFTWVGKIDIYPSTDNWIATEKIEPDLVYDGNYAAWQALTDAWNTVVAPTNLHWIGESTSAITNRTTRGVSGNLLADFGTITTTQDAYQAFASITPTTLATEGVDRVKEVQITQEMRSRDFIIQAYGLKKGAQLYAFFDGVNVTSFCTQIELVSGKTIDDIYNLFDDDMFLGTGGTQLTTPYQDESSNDVFTVKSTSELRTDDSKILLIFRVPHSDSQKFLTGQREFKLTDSLTNADSTTTTYAKKEIFSVGLSSTVTQTVISSRPFEITFDDETLRGDTQKNVIRNVQQNVEIAGTRRRPPPPPPVWDPLSQSFTIDPADYPNGIFVSSIGLHFRTKSDDNDLGVTVEIREMSNGFPTRKVIEGSKARIENENITISSDATEITYATFSNPVYLLPDTEYCFTITPDGNASTGSSTDYTLWVAGLGEIDITQPDEETVIEKQPYTGVVFTSSNDYTWSVRQNIDVTFVMKIARFDTSGIAYFQNKNVSTAKQYSAFTLNAEDVAISGTNIDYEIQLADSAFTESSFQSIKNLERNTLLDTKQISISSDETDNDFKSVTLKTTLTTTDPYVSPYIDLQRLLLIHDRNVINNEYFTEVDGTIEFSNGSNIVVGTGTDFANDVFAGEFALFGEEYRRITNIANATYLTVQNNFTTSNTAGETLIIRHEEAPTGPYTSEARHITRTVTLNDGFEASDLVVYLDVNRPAGTSIRLYAKVLNENDTDTFSDKFYSPMTLDGTETFTQNPSLYREEKYILPAASKTGGSELLTGTVQVNNVNSVVIGTSTRFLEDLRIGDTIAVGTARVERTVSTIANNTHLTVDSAFASNTSGEDIFKVLNNVVSYTTPDGRNYEGYKYFSIKIVFLSSNDAYACKIKNLRAIALA